MVVAGMAGLALAFPALGSYLRGTYFTVGQLHLLGLGIVLTSFLAGLFHWYSTWWNRSLSTKLGPIVALTLVLGLILSFVPMLILGSQGLPKALRTYGSQFEALHLLSSIGSLLLAGSILFGIAVLIWNAYRGEAIGNAAELRDGGEFSYRNMSPTGAQESIPAAKCPPRESLSACDIECINPCLD
jgi:cytochrome c oxidase subunit 1